jgi:hypothetical protein
MGRRGLEKTSQQGKLKSQWTKAFGCWIRRVRLPDFAPPTTPPGSAFLISLPLPLPLALSLSLWRDASTGMIDVGLSLEFTRLQRKWAMASVDPEVPPPPPRAPAPHMLQGKCAYPCECAVRLLPGKRVCASRLACEWFLRLCQFWLPIGCFGCHSPHGNCLQMEQTGALSPRDSIRFGA